MTRVLKHNQIKKKGVHEEKTTAATPDYMIVTTLNMDG